MKRALVLMALTAITLGAIAASTPLPKEVRAVLEAAITSEREAVARYQLYATKADVEGYRGAAALFRAQALAERTHAKRLAAILREHDLALPAEQTPSLDAGTTSQNLKAAGLAERAEQNGSYREAIEICKVHGATAIAKILDQTRDSEVEHANLCGAAVRDLDSMKEARSYYVCGTCGYTTDIGLKFCPACQHKGALEAIE